MLIGVVVVTFGTVYYLSAAIALGFTLEMFDLLTRSGFINVTDDYRGFAVYLA